jgi:hypothetical protein
MKWKAITLQSNFACSETSRQKLRVSQKTFLLISVPGFPRWNLSLHPAGYLKSPSTAKKSILRMKLDCFLLLKISLPCLINKKGVHCGRFFCAGCPISGGRMVEVQSCKPALFDIERRRYEPAFVLGHLQQLSLIFHFLGIKFIIHFSNVRADGDA